MSVLYCPSCVTLYDTDYDTECPYCSNADDETIRIAQAAPRITSFDVLRLASSTTGISRRIIRSEERGRQCLTIRAAIAVVARNKLHRSLSQIGNAINRDHTTVHHALRTRGHLPEVKELTDKLSAAVADLELKRA